MTIEDNISSELERIRTELEKLSQMKIHIGIQGASGYGAGGEGKPGAPADIMTIANVNEFGATISAKKVKNLAIPIAMKSKGKSPRDFKNLFFLSIDGLLYGCIDKKEHKPRASGKPRELKPKNHKPTTKQIKTGKDGDIEFLFILLPSVTIPERSFIRAGYDNNRAAIEDIASNAMKKIVFQGWDAETAANNIGMSIVGMIQEYMNQPFNFKEKGSITKATSSAYSHAHPLVQTGRLRNSITYRIEGGE